MIIGDQYKFAILFERIAPWNISLTDCNGVFALCIDGKLFPDEIINSVVEVSVNDIKKSLMNIPVDEIIFNMDTENAFTALYKLVYSDCDNDYRYELANSYLTDIDNLVFAVAGKEKIKILAAKGEYNCEESTHIFDTSEITEVILEKKEIDEIINKLEQEFE